MDRGRGLDAAEDTGLSLTVDYFNIDIGDTILTLAAGDIMVTCANTGDPDLCGLINRDEHGSLWLTRDSYVETNRQNIGQLISEGIDLQFNYLIGLGGAGFLSTDLIGTYLMTSSIDNRLTSYDCAGYYGLQCGQPNPHWQHRLRATWETAFNTFFSLGWRMVGPAEVDDASPDPDLGDPDQMELWRINGADEIDAQHYLDFSISYDLKQKVRFTVGVNNILDTEPPFFWGSYNGVYDPLGRFISANVEFAL